MAYIPEAVEKYKTTMMERGFSPEEIEGHLCFGAENNLDLERLKKTLP